MNDGYRNGLAAQVPAISIDFFVTFSRFDFALKRGGFLAGEIGRKASADWDRFATCLGSPFLEAIKQDPAIAIFFEEPPRRLLVKSIDVAEFCDEPEIVNTQMLFGAVRQVRNNLFHGEKGYIGQRDEKLMRAALSVLDHAFGACAANEELRGVCDAFAYAEINAH